VLPPDSLSADLDHYLPRTAHGSSLSPGVHASLLARAGRADEAAAWLRLAARLDLDDLTGTTAGGLHLATMGSVWQALVVGFLGARAGPAALHVDPRPLPTGWRRLAARLRFRGQPLELDLRPGRMTVRADHAGARVPVRVQGCPTSLQTPLVLTDHGGAWRPEVDHAP
jgi:trehalose/maltose hydrolase-like predicted phosphorylase